MSSLEIDIRGERLRLLPERAVVWPATRSLIVADTHFGKSEVFGRGGLAVPAGDDALDSERLTRLLQAHGAQRLIVLGDFLHARLERGSETLALLDAWLDSLRPMTVLVVAGNHDRHVLQTWRPAVCWENTDWQEGPFRFVHADSSLESGEEADAPDESNAFAFSGHVHPVVRLGPARSKRRPRLPAFWQHARGMVLPSFGSFTGGAVVHARAGERVFVAGPESVVALPPVKPFAFSGRR